MVATIIVAAVLAVWFLINLKKMIDNVKQGKSIDGCDGNCSHCKGCK